MPRTTKETIENDKNLNQLNQKNVSSTKKKSTKSTTTTKKTETKSTKTSKATSKSTKKSTTKKSSTKTASAVSKKTTSTKKTPTKKQTKSKQLKPINVLEYYDLPYRYNETIVKILAQTPKTLFVYWDVSDNDKENYIKQYGNDFFEKTKPILIIHNTTMNYTFEIEINDFANCWYFNINDEKCEYSVELGRKFKESAYNYNNIDSNNNYIHITSSNKIESPNGHILFEKEQKVVFYKDVKTNQTFSKNISNLEFIKYFGKANKIQDIYAKIYKDELLSNINNPSSH